MHTGSSAWHSRSHTITSISEEENTDLILEEAHGVIDCCALCLKSNLHAGVKGFTRETADKAADDMKRCPANTQVMKIKH